MKNCPEIFSSICLLGSSDLFFKVNSCFATLCQILTCFYTPKTIFSKCLIRSDKPVINHSHVVLQY